jgi:mono/diheme cytochrome c family protein
MKAFLLTAVIALGLSLLARDALAQQMVDYGKAEFDSNCASCHGITGKGDGPLSRIYLNPKPADLTTIAKRSGGVFPAERMFEIIDGRKEVEAHGPRTMPVWGSDYRKDVPDLSQVGLYGFRDTVVNTKIAALIDYLYRLQEK